MTKKEQKNNVISIDHNDDQEDYDGFLKLLQENTERVKNSQANKIFDMGDTLLSEIESKKKIKSKKAVSKINYIVKKSDNYSKEYLEELDYNDVENIYSEIKYENRGFFVKLLELFYPNSS